MSYAGTKTALSIPLMILITLLTGCTLAPAQQYKYSDEVEYLYPEGVNQVPVNGVSVAALPLRMGVVSVPDSNPRGG